MTVTTSDYDTNTKKIVSLNELSSTATISAVDGAITTLGWEKVYSNSGFVPLSPTTQNSAYSPLRFYVYRKQNADQVTYKYFLIYWDVIQRMFWTSTCELFNASTQVITNQSWTGNGSFPHGYDIRNGMILVGATTRHIFIWPFSDGNNPGLWSMVCEFERLGQEDTAQADSTTNGPPCYAWTCSLLIGGQYGTNNTQPYVGAKIFFAFPRVGSYTDGNAAIQYVPRAAGSMWPPYYNVVAPFNGSYTSPCLLFGQSATTLAKMSSITTYAWNTQSRLAWPVSADTSYQYFRPLGNIYNVGVTNPVGFGLGELVNTTIDSTGGWPSRTGNASNMIALPMHYFKEFSASGFTATDKITQIQTYISSTSSSLGFAGQTQVAAKIVSIGNGVCYLAAKDGVRRWNNHVATGTNTTTVSGGTELIYADTGTGVTDIIFDGERTIYAAGSSGLIKIDTETLSVTTATLTSGGGGAAYIALDAVNVYVTYRTNYAYSRMAIFPRSSDNLTTQTTVIAQYSSTDPTIFTTPQPDYNGYVIVSSATTGGTSTAINKLEKWNITSTPVVSYYLSDPLRTTSTLNSGQTVCMWLDPTDTAGRIWYFNVRSGTVNLCTLSGTLTATTKTGLTGLTSTGTAISLIGYEGLTTNQYGDGYAFPFRGAITVGTKRPGTGTAGVQHRVIPENPIFANAAFGSFSSTTQIGSGPFGLGAQTGSDGTFYYGINVGGSIAHFAYNYYLTPDLNDRLLVKA